MTVDRLSGLDAAFLYLETPTQHMHVTGTMVLEADTPEDAAAHAETLTAILLRRLTRQAAFRRRVVPAPLGVAHPAWVEYPQFRASDHVRLLALPSPGTIDQLAALVGQIASVPLDRGRPMWELTTITGLEGGRIGVVLKVHHALLDGVAGLEVLAGLFTTEPEHEPSDDLPTGPVEPAEPTALWLAGSALLAALHAPSKIVQTLLHTARAVVPLARESLRRQAAAVPAVLPFSAPRSVFNRALSSERAVAFGRVPLGEVKEIRAAFGVTVNDVVLAACARALGDYLRAHGEPPGQPIVASVPVSEHVTGEGSQPRNQVSAMFVGLPVHLTDVAAIVAFIQEQSRGAKQIYESFGPAMLADWAELAPPRLFAQAAELYSRWQLAERLPPPHSLVISNVPGPPFAMYAGTARLGAAYPLGPVLEGAGINITVLSYAGSVDIGLITCPRAVAEPAEIARGFERAMAELLEAARRLPGNRRAAGS